MGIVPVIPSLLLIRSSKTRCVTLTQKKNLKIGTQKNSDIVINLPYFASHTEVLGRDSEKNELQKQAITSHILPFYTFSIDGLCVRYIHLSRLLFILVFLCIGTLSIFNFLQGYRDQSNVQDWTPIVLPANGIYGYCRQDRTHGEGIHFSFQAKSSQLYRLQFFAGGKGDGTIIKLSLNGFETDISLTLPTGWGNKTSVVLPSALVKDGENSVIFNPKNHSNNRTFWGVSEIRVAPVDRSSSTIPHTLFHSPEEVLNALRDQDLEGSDLASYYKYVGTWDTSINSKDVSISRDLIMAKIEQRMRDKLHQVAFKVRSNQMLDDQSRTRQMLAATVNWLPENWAEGWEIYREICQ